jgi:hypothetical protein
VNYRHRLLVFLLAAPLAIPPGVAAQAAVAGIVREDGTGRPVPGVEIRTLDKGLTATTDSMGRFLVAGKYTGTDRLLFRKIGYLPAMIAIAFVTGDTIRANQLLIPNTVELEPIVVEANPRRSGGIGRDGFESRQALGFGRFYDTPMLRANEHLGLADLLRRQGASWSS